MLSVWTRSELRAQGWSAQALTAAVRAGELIRARQDRYLVSSAPPKLVQAVRVGGRLGCLSLLAILGVFVFDSSVLHVHMTRGASRMRSAHDRRQRLADRRSRQDVVLHWHPLSEVPSLGCVAIVDALVHAVRCQAPRHAIATLDSALNRGVVTIAELADVFANLPRRFGVLRDLLDARAQSGTETLVRLMARSLGCDVELQVKFAGVGFVDLVLDGWLVVECDSEEFHSDWKQRLKDYRRDQRLAAMGYCVLRVTAEDVLWHPEAVSAALRGLVTSRRPGAG